ncbi:hypothetical protein EV649_2941 [Kribbella sp. VKM Ac-2569]|uniref:hypothetical protein n=1 Tax=Kribbella sp. VKM Ac-2569 TaxID=2512220 RepID=UPI00102B61A0|nr:hypothetical protein [Kribbella sp. VKM Ac-2569]RZT19802.1 hypothetical protein EV649_2941 [Kribbella sp. VKM Ac-2569]
MGMNNLPEPADLHAWLSERRPLDWGDPIPTKAEIAAKYGEGTAARSLQMLTKAAAVEPRITNSMISAIGAEATPYHLENRLKSPQSLARKLVKFEDYYRRSNQVPEDVLRYTAAVKHPDELTQAAIRTIDRLNDNEWQTESAHHSYVDGSRYKGLHAFLRAQGEKVELQVHSGESIEVKERTTPLYQIERDRDQPPAARDAARRECIALSDQMTQPAGIEDLKELGGVSVDAISYGKKRQQHRSEPGTVRESEPDRTPEQTHQQFRNRQNGTSR